MDEYQFPDLNEQERASVCRRLISAVKRDDDVSEHETCDSWNYKTSALEIRVEYNSAAKTLYAFILNNDADGKQPVFYGCPKCGCFDVLLGKQGSPENEAPDGTVHATFKKPAAYDRPGVRSPNRMCFRCGYLWYSSRKIVDGSNERLERI